MSEPRSAHTNAIAMTAVMIALCTAASLLLLLDTRAASVVADSLNPDARYPAPRIADFNSSYKTGPLYAQTNDVITYAIVAVNTGTPVTNVILADPLPATAVFVPGSCTYWSNTSPPQSCGPLNQMWQEDFGTGERITTTFAVQVTAGSMNWPMVNCATLNWDSSQDQMCFTTMVNPPRFASSYKTGPQYAQVTDVITYTVVAVNTGGAVTDVVLSDVLPYTTLYVPGSCIYWSDTSPPQACGPLNQMWQEDFGTGERITTTFAVQVTAGSMNWPTINCATLNWDSGQEQLCFTTTVNSRLSNHLPVIFRNHPPPPAPTPTPTPTLQPASLTLAANPQVLTEGETSSLVATALDSYGAPITNLMVTFSTSDPLGGGALAPASTTTDNNGQATATLSSNLVGVVRVTAEASNGTLAFVDVYFNTTGFCAPELVTEVDTGSRPREVALDTAGNRAFVAHANGVTVIDTNSLAPITEIPSLSGAHGIAYDPDNDHIWVARKNADRVVVLDGTLYTTLADLPAGDGPHSVAYNPANARIYVTNYWGDTVTVYDALGLDRERTLGGFEEPAHIAVNPVTNKIYVANHSLNSQIIVIRGDTHSTDRIGAWLLDAYGVAVDTTRNLIYATSIEEGRLSVIDGNTDQGLGYMDIWRNDGRKVPLRVIAANSGVGSQGHLLLTTSSEDRGEDQFLLIPNGWPTLGAPVPLDIASYPLEGIALDPDTDRVWVTSVDGGLVNVVQDGEPVCLLPFSILGSNDDSYQFEVSIATPMANKRFTRDRLSHKALPTGR